MPAVATVLQIPQLVALPPPARLWSSIFAARLARRNNQRSGRAVCARYADGPLNLPSGAMPSCLVHAILSIELEIFRSHVVGLASRPL
jgi:hypothetical protein